ncbi:MAG: PQQ-binding-like beta-propeller repeat protein [Candidatus Hinthialibacter antarcticus]|nr:PQQ-binding-like beta-propeller repeat protein [Candidatus Hinthialibacter antarcticus]
MMKPKHWLSSLLTVALVSTSASAEDWSMWGGTPNRNMMSPETGIPADFTPGHLKDGSEEIDLSTTENVKWVAKLGSQAYGNPTIAGGKVFIGTNNESPRNEKHIGDRGNIYCLDEKTGEFLWQLVVPKLGAGKVSDWEYLGICSSPTIDVEKGVGYVVTNRCEVVCFDIDGLSDGNDGPFKDEGQYMAGPGNPPMEISPTDADIIWTYDMRDELGVFPHNIASSSTLLIDGKLFVTTSNGQDWSHINIPAPFAPTLIVLDPDTGELIGEEASEISQHLYHCNWSSPSYGVIGGKPQAIFGAGDGFCYGFDLNPVEDDEGFLVLKELWKYDCNPPHYKMKDGQPIRYPAPEGPNEIIGTPVVYKDKVYVAIGQDPEHGEGVGVLQCIDATKRGDITTSGKVWSYEGIRRTISTVSIMNGLVFAADYSGVIHCLDAETGELYWKHDTLSHIWGSTIAVDGKVYVGNEDGVLTILAADKTHKVLKEIEFDAPVYSTPVVANGVLYIGTQTHLYAIAD